MKSNDTEQGAHSAPTGFNWGAFFLTWIWAIGHKAFDAVTFMLLLLCFVPYVGIVSAIALTIYSGMTGNRRAWNKDSRQDLDAFLLKERRWAIIGAAQLAILLVLLAITPFFYLK